MMDRSEVELMQALAATADEPPLWQALADALNALLDYGLDPIAGTVSSTLIDAGDVIHGAGVRVAGQRLRWLGAGGNEEHDHGSKWIVEERDNNTPGEA
jgi:hypothetical protein